MPPDPGGQAAKHSWIIHRAINHGLQLYSNKQEASHSRNIPGNDHVERTPFNNAVMVHHQCCHISVILIPSWPNTACLQRLCAGGLLSQLTITTSSVLLGYDSLYRYILCGGLSSWGHWWKNYNHKCDVQEQLDIKIVIHISSVIMTYTLEWLSSLT